MRCCDAGQPHSDTCVRTLAKIELVVFSAQQILHCVVSFSSLDMAPLSTESWLMAGKERTTVVEIGVEKEHRLSMQHD